MKLRRVTGELFRARIGETIQIRAEATNNPGSDIASFEYNGVIVPNDTGSTSACTFDVVPGIQQFQASVVFAPGAGGDAQYDLFELDANGDAEPLDESVTPDGSVPLIGFGIQGVAAVAGVAKKAVAKKAAKKAAKKPKKAAKKVAKKAAKKTAKSAKNTAEKTARKRAKTAATKDARPVAKRPPRRPARKKARTR